MKNTRTSRRRFGAVAVALSLAAVGYGGAIATASPAGTPKSAGAPTETLTVVINNVPQSLDPAKNGGGPQRMVQWFAYEPLIRSNPDGSYAPGLAESWEYVGEGNEVFEVTLRSDATFADGTPVTTTEVVDSLEYFIATPSPVHSLIETVESVEAPDDQTVRVTFSTPNPDAARLLSQEAYGNVISSAGLAAPDDLGTATFGAGPYVLDPDDTVSGDHYSLVPNDTYWNPDVQHWAKVVVRVITDPTTAFNAVQTEQANVSTGTIPAQLAEAESAGLDILRGGQIAIVTWIMDRLGESQPALGDVRVREALNLAVDRESIAAALGDAYTPLSQFAPVGNPLFVDDRPAIEYDPERAQELLAEAGYEDGFELALVTNTDNRDADVSQILVEQWRAIGVDVSLQTFDNQPSEMFGGISDMQFNAVTFALNAQVAAFEALLTRESVFNPWGASDPAVEEAFQAWAVSPPEEVDAAAEAVGASINDLYWFVPVASVELFLVSQGVADLGTMSSEGQFDVLSWTPEA